MLGRPHIAFFLMLSLLAGLVLYTLPIGAQQPTSPPPAAQETRAFAYAAPAFIKELDSKFSFPPPVPPSPPPTGGVLHIPTGVIRAFDPTAGYGTELAMVWDTLLEWESMWNFPEGIDTMLAG